ncbi:cytochrome c peroxidase [Planktotalea frisia]|jgi:cytochrome c peroxidase|uniref:Cytochrome c551 peroxidase n=1 Tax=Planktotalea frisia TaxID=696762 RepID=A0A1L9NY11_9RHOB|nr:cytochrome c peroxidase [Planktotalea frisia]OJI94147.1 cytochrome c551 peroxidase precursor [Planktotalea frisia]PZX29657.1 cytochrome c peroxidase [Planktotalea frisia]
MLPLSAQANDLPAPLTPDQFHPSDPEKARIGQLLFYDKILSGNRNISCGTCHHHDHGGTDGLSLGIGEGGIGVGPKRTAGTGDSRIRKRIPRNAPALWNIGHKSITNIFHDGRLSISDIYGNGFNSPAEEWLPKGLDNITAAQALFPLTAQFEMAGNPKENQVAGAVHDRIDAAWPIIAKRVRAIPEYADMFAAAFEEINEPQDLTIVQIGNALGAFINTEWQSHDSLFDAYIENNIPLPEDAARGMALFYGKADCASCHSGPLFTDQKFLALGLPAFGPGRTRRFDPMPRDVGRMGESDALEDAYRFRTPPLRNIALTAPYGHNGAFPTLESMIQHHINPKTSRSIWTRDMANLPAAPWLQAIDFTIQSDTREMKRQNRALDITPMILTPSEISDLESFLHSLTGKSGNNRPLGRPATVPSGLSVD